MIRIKHPIDSGRLCPPDSLLQRSTSIILTPSEEILDLPLYWLWFAMNVVISYVQYIGKTACYVYQISYQYQFFSSIATEYEILENIKILSQYTSKNLLMDTLVPATDFCKF